MRPAVLVSVSVVDPVAYRVGARDADDGLAQAIAVRDVHGASFAARELVLPAPPRRRRRSSTPPPRPTRTSSARAGR